MKKHVLFIILNWFCVINLYGQNDTISNFLKLKYKANSSVSNYNLACLYAQNNFVDSAFKYLNYSIDLGEKDGYALYDSDLILLHSDTQWIAIRNKINSIFLNENACTDTATLLKLREFFLIDQSLRYELEMENFTLEAKSKFNLLDSINIYSLDSYLDKSTLPTKKEIGEQGMNYMFMFLLHISYALKLKYEPYFLNRLKNGDFNLKQKAFFVDKMLISQGKKQRYGTQLEFVRSENRIRMKQVENINNLNILRKEMGLESIEDYLNWNNATIE